MSATPLPHLVMRANAREYRWPEGQYNRAPSMAAELQVAVIVANTLGI